MDKPLKHNRHTMKIWVLDSGLQGDRAQILGLAEALARKTEATISSYDVSVRAWAKLLPKPASYFVKTPKPRTPNERPDVIIACGQRTKAVAMAVRRVTALLAFLYIPYHQANCLLLTL